MTLSYRTELDDKFGHLRRFDLAAAHSIATW